MAVTTVGELIEELKKHDPGMPLWLKASCYTHNDRVFTQVCPDTHSLSSFRRVMDSDGTEVVEYHGVSVCVSEEEHEFRDVKKPGGRWKYEHRKYLCIDNASSDEMRLEED